MHWYKDELQGIEITNNKFAVISNISASKEHSLPTRFFNNQAAMLIKLKILILEHMMKYLKKNVNLTNFLALEKKIMAEVIEDSDEEIYHEVLEFFRLIQK